MSLFSASPLNFPSSRHKAQTKSSLAQPSVANDPQQAAAFVELSELTLAYGGNAILHNISLRIFAEEIVCLLGPSGCGKTTLLKAIAGFTVPVRGNLHLNHVLVSSPEHVVAPAERNITMLFQDLALFPHLTVAENIRLAMKKTALKTQNKRIDTLAQALKLEDLLKKYPHTISGGEQQRTALARALAPHPLLILLDEPLSSQDIELKQKLQLALKVLLKEEKITTLFVTHDQEEAFALSDKMGVIHNHHLEQYGSPYEIYYQPRSRFIADFIGKGSLVNGIIEEGILISEFGRIKKFQLVTQDHVISHPANVPLATKPYKRESMHVKVLVRPDDVHLDNRSAIRARISETIFQGSHFLYILRLQSGTKLLSLMPSTYRYNKGEEVGIAFSFQHIVVFA